MMKLFTKPRPNLVALLRPGDQLARHAISGNLIQTEAEFMDADLQGEIRWSVVHELQPVAAELLRVLHTHGHDNVGPGRPVITREVVEIDPWTYLVRVDTPEQPQGLIRQASRQ